MDDTNQRVPRRPSTLWVPLLFPLLRPPSTPSSPRGVAPRSRLHRILPWAILGAAIALPFAAVPETASVATFQSQFYVAATDLGASFTRMVIAYFFSLGFALAYGYYAATNRTAERILIPILDVLQSVPILGFLPIVIGIIASVFIGGFPLGANVAVIFLIFTVMSWNMAFGVYEALKSLPTDLRESADSFGVQGWKRVRRLILPATTNRLVYNTVLSWTAGWYFLVGAEIITAGTKTVSLPGIGSYLAEAAFTGAGSELVIGLSLLVALVAVLDLFVWRPAGRWAEKFRYEQSPGGEGVDDGGDRPKPVVQRAAGFMARGFASGVSRLRGPVVTFVRHVPVVGGARSGPRTRSAIRRIAFGALLVVVWLILIELSVSIYHVLVAPIPHAVLVQIESLPLALLYSLGRIGAAYLISVALVLPLAIFLVSRPRAFRLGLPVVEIIASMPTSSLFPIFIFALAPFVGLNGIAILLLVTGMAWYLFFNIMAGLRGVPADLKEAAASYGLSRRLYYRRLVFPAIFPAFVTGSITAVGSGWNTLVFAEYFAVNGQVLLHVLGVGELLSLSSLATPPVYALSVSALFTLILTVVVINELVWKPLYRRAVDKYRFD